MSLPDNTLRASEFRAGVIAELPLLLGIVPFGLAFGILGIESGLSATQTIFMSSIVFGGAGQIVFVELYTSGTPLVALVCSVAVVNMRHLLYGLSLTQYIGTQSLMWRLRLSYLLTDEAYAVSIRRFREQPHNKAMHYHLLGSGITLWLCWQAATAGGVLLGQLLPASLQLEFAIPLTYIAVVVPMLRHTPQVLCALTACIVTVLLYDLPWNLWLIAASLCAIAVGVLSQRLQASHG